MTDTHTYPARNPGDVIRTGYIDMDTGFLQSVNRISIEIDADGMNCDVKHIDGNFKKHRLVRGFSVVCDVAQPSHVVFESYVRDGDLVRVGANLKPEVIVERIAPRELSINSVTVFLNEDWPDIDQER